MTVKTQGNINVSNEPVTPAAISIGSVTAVTLIPAPSGIDNPWRWVSIYNDGNQALWLRFYTAGTDAIKKGTRLPPGVSKEFELPNMPSTEISGIFNSGGARDVYVQYF